MLVLAACLAVAIGLCLGLFGAGGGILLVPTLVHVLGVPAKQAIVTSLVVIGAASLLALVTHARAGHVKVRIGVAFGVAGMAGAYGGGRVAQLVSPATLLVGLAVLMALASFGMLRGRSAGPPRPMSLARGIVIGACAGFVSGMVGAGGGFIIVPALVLFGGLSMADAIGTSLLVVAMQSIAGAIGHVAHTPIDLHLTATVAVFTVVGSLVGARLSRRISPDRLRFAFAWGVCIVGMTTLAHELVGYGFSRVAAGLLVAPIAVVALLIHVRARARSPRVEEAS